MPHATITGFELFHERRGSGEPLLLIQGLSGTHVSWGEPLLSRLQRDFDVVVYDHRGVGRSSPVTDPFTIVDLAEDAAGLLDALGWASAHVLGISMGGMIAQELALRHREKVRTLALGCTYCGGPESRLTDDAVGRRIGEALTSRDRDLAIRTMYEVNVSAAYAAETDNYAAFLAMAKSMPAPVSVIMLQAQAVGEHDTSERLPSLDIPTLVIHGDEDQMLVADNGRQIASLIPGARLEILEGVGHMFWWEQPERSAVLVRDHALSATASA